MLTPPNFLPSDYEICPYATFSLANVGPGAGAGSGAVPVTPSKSLASYSLQLHTFSQWERDCYAEGPPLPLPLPASRAPRHNGQHYSRGRSKAGKAGKASAVSASSAAHPAATPRPADSGEALRMDRRVERARGAASAATASPPDGLSLGGFARLLDPVPAPALTAARVLWPGRG